MGSIALENLMLKYFNRLNEVQQRKAIAFIESLANVKELKSIDQLLENAGCISADLADEMEITIAEGCEKIDVNEW